MPTNFLQTSADCETSKSDKVINRIVGLKETEDVKEENLFKVTYINSNCLQITYDERLSLPDNNKDLKKRLKEKVLHNNKGKLVIDYKSTQVRRHWGQGGQMPPPPNNFDNALFDYYKLGKMLKSINSIVI